MCLSAAGAAVRLLISLPRKLFAMRISNSLKRIFAILSAILLALGLLLGLTLHAQSGRSGPLKLPIQDVRFGPRTVLVSDPNRHTLTLTPGSGDVDVCAPHDGGKSCRPAQAVIAWLLADAPVE